MTTATSPAPIPERWTVQNARQALAGRLHMLNWGQ
jgi:hypothetical protein